MSGLSYSYILQRDSDPPHCSEQTREYRLRTLNYIRWAPEYAKGEISVMDEQPRRGILYLVTGTSGVSERWICS